MSIFTILQLKDQNSFRRLYKLLMIISFVSLLSAYYVEYVMNLPPCILCLYQRYCYFFLIIFSGCGIILKNNHKQITFFIILTLITACAVAGYHAGVERGIFAARSLCASQINIPDDLAITEVKDMLYNKPIASCAHAALKVLGLSMSEWNLLLNIGLLLMTLRTWMTRGVNYAQA